jgi:NAD-dependent deacetylase
MTQLFKPIVILTGAGISAESGIRTFRAADGLWEDHRIEDVATPEAFARDPELVQRFYNLRRAQLLDPAVAPNAGHLALARLEKAWEGDFLLVTQNVDNLHERAGSQRLLHMHGELQKLWCLACDQRQRWTSYVTDDSLCTACQKPRKLRPDIVWFGEMPFHMDVIEQALEKCELFLSIGTSGNVYPASGFVRWARHARKIEVNPASTPVSDDFHEHIRGPAGETLPALVERLLAK